LLIKKEEEFTVYKLNFQIQMKVEQRQNLK